MFQVFRKGHIASQFPNRRTMILRKDGKIEIEGEYDEEPKQSLKEDNEEVEYPVTGDLLVTRRALNVQVKEENEVQHDNIFHTRCHLKTRCVV